MSRHFYNKIKAITLKDSRYNPDAYEFVMDALFFTQKKFKITGHVGAKELLLGIKELILNKYGPLAKTVLNYWGVNTTDDFGEIVFNMINAGLMRRTEKDARQDFNGVYDFNAGLSVFKIKNQKPAQKKLIK